VLERYEDTSRVARGAGAGPRPLARLLGSDTPVPCVDGRTRRYANLDYAASTPAMQEVWEAVEAFMPWCSSVHRGSGLKSQVSTAAFEGAREDVARFVGARPADDVVFVRNTTEAINLFAAALPPGARVLSTPAEHHSNMLPWRRHNVHLLPFTDSAEELCAACEDALLAPGAGFDLVAVTGASNVTGELWPVAELARLAHRHGARVFVDAAQLAPHRPIDMACSGIDFLALSGHKLYAPFGAGALVGDAAWLEEGMPLLRGGGAIKWVSLDDVIWADAPERHEAGSPNVVGVVALGAACRALHELGMHVVAEHERELTAHLRTGLSTVPGLRTLALWPPGSVDSVGVAAFVHEDHPHALLAAALSAEHAIGVRHGCFCAHPLITRLLGIPDSTAERLADGLRQGSSPALPGAVRASIGLGTVPEDIDRLVGALHEIAQTGPRAHYVYEPEHNEYLPLSDPRGWPQLPFSTDRAVAA
jgi:selenocysteine lyase/cysteine desulfurase